MKVIHTPNSALKYFNKQKREDDPLLYLGSNKFLIRVLSDRGSSGGENIWQHVGWMEDDYSDYPSDLLDERLDQVWELLSEVPVEIDTDIDENYITEDFYIWKSGTMVLDIWAWFDRMYSEGLGKRHF